MLSLLTLTITHQKVYADYDFSAMKETAKQILMAKVFVSKEGDKSMRSILLYILNLMLSFKNY